MQRPTRRRFLAVSAAAALTAGVSTSVPAARWRGIALGAPAELRLAGLTSAEAAPVFSAITQEISRLEDIFSLYRPDSAISRLNRHSHIDAPPAELLQVFSVVTAIHDATQGAFDPTIQVLWTHAAKAVEAGEIPRPEGIANARGLVDWPSVRYDPTRIAFARRGMAMSLNGVAQGYITDRIADKLRRLGLTNVLVDMGEIRASGNAPNETPWSVAIAGPDESGAGHRIQLRNRALATSARFGTVLDPAGKIGHIFDPRSGNPAAGVRQVSVSAPTAVLADGLSTAFCLLRRPQIAAALRAFEGARLEDLVV